MLTLAEELYIIAIQDSKGTLIPLASVVMPSLIPCALLTDLYLEERLHLVRDQLIVKNNYPVGHPQLDHILNIINESHEKKPLKKWVEDLSKEFKQFKKDLVDRLIKKRILKSHEYHFLGLFPIRRLFLKKKKYQRDRLKALYSHVTKYKKMDTRTMALIYLIHAGGLHKSIFPKEHRKKAAQRIEEIMHPEQTRKYQDDFLVLIHEIVKATLANQTTSSAG